MSIFSRRSLVCSAFFVSLLPASLLAADKPKEIRIDPGTYFWRIVGIKGDKVIADSGRAAFVVME